MKINLNSFLYSISYAIDVIEEELSQTTKNHGKRVAYIALCLADEVGFDKKRKYDLCAYSILHDNGLLEAFRKNSQEKNLSEISKLQSHCIIGQENLKSFPFFYNRKDIVLNHHENYDGSGYFGKSGTKIDIMSQLITLADILDTKFNLNNITLKKKQKIEKFVKKNENKLFSSFLVSAFLMLSSKDIFWYDLESPLIESALDKVLPKFIEEISYEQLLSISKVFSKLIDAKSEFTHGRTEELTEKIKLLSTHYNLSKKKSFVLQIATNLHDLGKLGIPNEILEKTTLLTEDEHFIIKKHASLTFMILNGIEGLEEICNIASSHHERLDGSGYPFGLKEEQLKFEHRLLATLDVYQALVENRPQRLAMSHKEAIKVLKEQVKSNKLDGEIVDSIDEVFSN